MRRSLVFLALLSTGCADLQVGTTEALWLLWLVPLVFAFDNPEMNGFLCIIRRCRAQGTGALEYGQNERFSNRRNQHQKTERIGDKARQQQ